MSFRVIVAGSRNFSDYQLLEQKLDLLFSQKYGPADLPEIVSGLAAGPDSLGVVYAQRHGLAWKPFPANWDKYGKGAGYRRNEEMAAYADALVAFWDGKSKGTAHMIDCMRKRGLPVRVIRFAPAT